MKLSDITKMFFGNVSLTKEKLIGSLLVPKLSEGNGQFELQILKDKVRFGTTEAIAAHSGSSAIKHIDTKKKPNEIAILSFKLNGSNVSEVCVHDDIRTYVGKPMKSRGQIATSSMPDTVRGPLNEQAVASVLSSFVSRNTTNNFIVDLAAPKPLAA